MAVYGYVRVSVAAQSNDGVSLDVQQREIAGYAAMRGLDEPTMFVERGVSGAIPLAERPEGSKLWQMLQKGDILIASKLDRMFRSALDALQTVDRLKALGVSLILNDLGGDVSGNGLSTLFLTIAAAFAEAERARIRERVAQVKRDQQALNRYLGGKVPFGFRLGDDGALVEDTREQELIVVAIEMQRDKRSIRDIQAMLVQRGAHLSVGGIHKLLKRMKG